GRLQAGESVLINSVGSGIGSAAVQLAHFAGAYVIGNAGTDEKLARAAEFGLDHGINHQTQDVVEEVLRVTDGLGADLAYEHVGGTFTDLIYVHDEAGKILVHKVPTTPEDPSQGTVRGIRELTNAAEESPGALDQVFHGTTIATNIVIEHSGAKVGLITSEGYRDILHIARHKKSLNFSNYQDLPWQRYPIVRRRYRLTVPERITRDGSVLVPLDEERAREQVRRRKEGGGEAGA